LPRICVALGLPNASQLSRAAEAEYKDGSQFLEFRLDYLDSPASGIEVIRRIRRKYPDVYILATCRHHQASGFYKDEIGNQLRLLSEAARAGATFVDLEIETAEQAKQDLARVRELAPLCLSYHDFEKTPALPPLLRRLSKIPADLHKLALTARKPSDNLRLLLFLKEPRSTPLIALEMSETGLASRILGPSFGALYTYAAPCADSGTAPGQVPAKLMRNLYRSEKLTSQSRVYGLIASPVAHSKSPLIHNRAFQARRLDSVYLPFLVQPNQLSDWMLLASGLPIHGFSVTIPHKQRIIRYLDVVEPLAKRIGAVNTVWRKSGKWRGTNTDAEGVLRPLCKHVRLPHSSILIAGYGGAARAAAITLSDASAKITITGRNLRPAQSLARAVKGEVMSLAEAEKHQFDAFVNATPVGMAPNPNACVFSERVPAALVLDMVYNPHETKLLQLAAQQGATVIHGIDMLLEQAAYQFEIWTGESAPRGVMRNALDPL
jgi:3-dehydroquinate dehydratase/shikimate dehydrogenase